eukprot:1061149-Prymnesium_polylepis.1
MSDLLPRAGKRSRDERAHSSSSAEHAPASVDVGGLRTVAIGTERLPACGDEEAALLSGWTASTSQPSNSTCDGQANQSGDCGTSRQTRGECFSVDELKERAIQMFVAPIGKAPRSSGSRCIMASTTRMLIINVTKAIDDLMGTVKKHGPCRAEMIRSCGELDKEEARGWLVADAVGRPLLHRNDDRSQNDARDVGKRVLERSGKAKDDVASARRTGAAAVRAAKAAAAKYASLEPEVAAAERNAEADVIAAQSVVINLDLPD